MPVPFEQTPTGTILVKEPEAAARAVALYARVSSADQKADLDRQIARLVTYASEHEVTTIVVEHRDRLMRFGFEYVERPARARDGGLWWSSPVK